MRKGQKKPNAKRVSLKFRVSHRSYLMIQWLANTYAGGNLSKWLEHGALEAERKMLK